MKKRILSLGFSFVMALAMAAPVYAKETPQTCHISGCNMGECFMDEDCDGICGDHAFVDEDCDGICDNHCYTDEDADGICDHFVDEDADGICDHCHEHGKLAQTVNNPNTNRQRGHHESHHRGCHHGHC